MTDTDSLDALLNRARDGDKAAEDKIFRLLLVRFRYLAARRVGDKQTAEDIAQATCVTVLEKYKTQTFSVEFGAWAYGILSLLIRKHFSQRAEQETRGRAAAGAVLAGSAGAIQVDPDVETRLVECLQKVAAANRRYARALNLSYQGYTTEEICRRLKVNRNHLYVILNRARSMLWQCLQRT